MEIKDYSLIELAEKIQKRELSSAQVVRYYLDNIEKKKDLNAVLEFFDDALSLAEEMDKKIAAGFKGKLAGVPIIIKDNILYKGKKATCSSKFLENYVAQYNSTVVEKMLKEGAVIIGRANMDEFAMGSSTENSAFGVTKNALDPTRVAGGSSGGSAAAVAAEFAPCALGTDTGGSIRQPSSYNGVVGIKPTYGRVSRFGVVAFASSLEQVGPITKNVKDNAYMLEILAGHSEHDETSSEEPVVSYLDQIKGSIKGYKIAVLKQVAKLIKGKPIEKAYNKALEFVKAQGAEVVEVDLPEFELTLPCYYIIAPAEATSNLGRFDGVKYSTRAANVKDVDEIYLKSRTQGFGKEVKRRIMLGNFVLSSVYFDAYYNKAQKLQQKIKDKVQKVFDKCDIIMLPTTMGEAFKIGAKSDPVSMYLEDVFTILANIIGAPAITVPYEKGENGLPLGMQFIGNLFEEGKVYNIADCFMQGQGR
ncbi:MAG: Asp-tRNA(Asn)/Glu-tRNA(Gln) amidotransferase subunit GatA [Acetobacter sp.]|nr:Asp-tRNA(Asn)/Glu-tRNA(Gln) amidotransferase subunit GatA [Acetobacter sp.]